MSQENEIIEMKLFFTTSCTFPLKRKNEVAYQIKMLLIIKKTIDVIKMNTTKGINGLSL